MRVLILGNPAQRAYIQELFFPKFKDLREALDDMQVKLADAGDMEDYSISSSKRRRRK